MMKVVAIVLCFVAAASAGGLTYSHHAAPYPVAYHTTNTHVDAHPVPVTRVAYETVPVHSVERVAVPSTRVSYDYEPIEAHGYRIKTHTYGPTHATYGHHAAYAGHGYGYAGHGAGLYGAHAYGYGY